MHSDDDTPPPRPRWLGGVMIAFMLLVVLGMLNLGVRMVLADRGEVDRSTADAGTAAGSSPLLPAVVQQGSALVKASDCLRCHGMDRHYVGPSFRQIAGRYRDRAGAADLLARKIREGGVGEWGRTVMPRHPQVSEAQAQSMAAWLLALPPAEAAAVDAATVDAAGERPAVPASR